MDASAFPGSLSDILQSQVDAFFLRLPDETEEHWRARQRKHKLYRAYDLGHDYKARHHHPYKVSVYDADVDSYGSFGDVTKWSTNERPAGIACSEGSSCDTMVWTETISFTPPERKKKKVRWADDDYSSEESQEKEKEKDNKEETRPLDPWLPEFFQKKSWTWDELHWQGKAKRVVWDYSMRYVLLLLFLFVFILLGEWISIALLLLLGKPFLEMLTDSEISGNPLAAVMSGIISGSLSQSLYLPLQVTAKITSLQVIPANLSSFMVLGFHIGTTSSALLTACVFLYQDKRKLRRAVGGATVCYFLHLLTVLVLLGLEGAAGMLYYLTEGIVSYISNWKSTEFYLLRGATMTIVHKIIQIDLTPLIFFKPDMDHGKRQNISFIKTNCSSDGKSAARTAQSQPPFYGPCSFLFEPLRGKLSDTAIGAIILLLAVIFWLICLAILSKLVANIFKGKLARKTQMGCQCNDRHGCFYNWAAIIVAMFSSWIIQCDFVMMTCLILLCGRGIISLRRLYPLLIGVNIGGSLGVIIASLSQSDKVFFQMALTYLFITVLGTVAWYPTPPLRNFVLGIGRYFGENMFRYSWAWIPFMVLILFIIPALLIAIAAAGIVAFLVLLTPAFIIILAIIVINILQRKCPSALPKPLKTWAVLNPYLHRLKPYDETFISWKESCKSHKTVIKKKLQKKKKGNPEEFWERSRVYLYAWNDPKRNSAPQNHDTSVNI